MRELVGEELGTYTFLLLPGCLGFMLAVLHYTQQCPTKGRLWLIPSNLQLYCFQGTLQLATID